MWRFHTRILQLSRSVLRKHFFGKLHKHMGWSFLSDNSRLLICNCCIRDSVAGVFLWICEAVWSSYSVLHMAFTCTVYRYSKEIYRKTPMSQFLFNEVAGRHLQALLKEVCLLERQTEVLMNIFLYLFCHNKNCDLWWLNLWQ